MTTRAGLGSQIFLSSFYEENIRRISRVPEPLINFFYRALAFRHSASRRNANAHKSHPLMRMSTASENAIEVER